MLITEVNERKGNKHFVCKICKSIGEGNERTEVVPGRQGRIGRVFFFGFNWRAIKYENMLRGNCQGRGRDRNHKNRAK